jgi:transglutaminase-like putative cysteine protease
MVMESPMSHMDSDEARLFLAPGEYIDSEHPAVVAEAKRLTCNAASPRERARVIYHAVRDMTYHADDFTDLETFRASSVLALGRSYCAGKASLCVALCRATGLPARIAFADVTNHLSNARLRELMGTDLFAWHGYCEILLDGRWVKVSPTFDAALCERLGVRPLEFDGLTDALLQAYDGEGRLFMSYDRPHGTFHDVPARFLVSEMLRRYPAVCAAMRAGEFRRPPLV